ncbi:MAG TPA: M20/M25/M40 family metallo-hydrolase [Bacteroidales bacterium]|nr:M20/M25/M40 family metallo-hydrolase [Bacteroidales bacterium]
MHRYKILLTGFFLVNLMLQAQENLFLPERSLQHIMYLSSEDLGGRYPGTTGDKLAASYIRDRFAVSGLTLLYENGYQSFDVVTGVELRDGNSFYTRNFEAVVEEDFVPLSFSSNTSATGPVVFAGYGIVMPGQWDDYADVDVTGKWVLALVGDPEPDNPQSDFIPHSTDRMKAVSARDRRAAGLLLVKGPAIEADDKLMPAYYDKTASDAGIPVLNITRRLANHLISGRGFRIEDLEKELQTSMQPFSFDAFTEVSAEVSLAYTTVSTQNIVAKIQGSHPSLKEEIIVIGAHYDHLGKGGTGSGSRMPDTVAVHYGADDNASGIAALLELAAALPLERFNLQRSIIFVAFGAEEMGLVGSKYFVDNLPFAANQIKTMINLDMIGRLKDEAVLTIGGTGTALEMDEILSAHEPGRIFSISRQPDGYGPSDHAAFYTSSIPVLFFTTGPHPDYHTPLDIWEKINSQGMVAIQEFVFDIVKDLAIRNDALTFTESGTMARRGHGRGYKIALGIIPDVASARNGLGVDGVRQDGPAARAGITRGDVIVGMNGMPVSNIYEYMARINTLSAGDTVIVEVMRNGKKEVLLVQL